MRDPASTCESAPTTRRRPSNPLEANIDTKAACPSAYTQNSQIGTVLVVNRIWPAPVPIGGYVSGSQGTFAPCGCPVSPGVDAMSGRSACIIMHGRRAGRTRSHAASWAAGSGSDPMRYGRYRHRGPGTLLVCRTMAVARRRSRRRQHSRPRGPGRGQGSLLAARSRPAWPRLLSRCGLPPRLARSSAAGCARRPGATPSRRPGDGTSRVSARLVTAPSTRAGGRSSPPGRPASACWISAAAPARSACHASRPAPAISAPASATGSSGRSWAKQGAPARTWFPAC